MDFDELSWDTLYIIRGVANVTDCNCNLLEDTGIIFWACRPWRDHGASFPILGTLRGPDPAKYYRSFPPPFARSQLSSLLF